MVIVTNDICQLVIENLQSTNGLCTYAQMLFNVFWIIQHKKYMYEIHFLFDWNKKTQIHQLVIRDGFGWIGELCIYSLAYMVSGACSQRPLFLCVGDVRNFFIRSQIIGCCSGSARWRVKWSSRATTSSAFLPSTSFSRSRAVFPNTAAWVFILLSASGLFVCIWMRDVYRVRYRRESLLLHLHMKSFLQTVTT